MKPIKKYKTWLDKRTMELVTYNNRWTKEDWENLELMGELQPHQNPFKMDSWGVYRMLYGKEKHYKYIQGLEGKNVPVA